MTIDIERQDGYAYVSQWYFYVPAKWNYVAYL